MPQPQCVGLDIETTGLYPVKGSKIFCVTVNDGKKTDLYNDPMKVKKLCEDERICKIIHNAAFDSFWLKQLCGIEVKNIWDTKLIEQVLIGDNLISEERATEEEKMVLSSNLLYTLKRYKLPVHDKSFGYNFSVRPINKPLTKDEIEYAKNDVKYLHHIKALQEIRLAKLDLTKVAFLENKVVEVTVRMRCNGIGIDKAAWLKIEQDNINKSLYLQKRLPSSVSNWNSPAQAKKYFINNGIPVNSLEDLTDDFIKKYNNKTLNDFVQMRKCSTYASKYGSKFLYTSKRNGKGEDRYLVDPDGRIRADFFQILNTGRFSVSKPPLHGLPRDGDQRSAFVPRKGHCFVDGDFGGQEIGIMAAASNEPLWVKALLRGEDPLSLMASIMFRDWHVKTERGCTFPFKCKCKGHKELRQISKEVTYGIAYGAYPKSVSVKINRTVNETYKLFYKHQRSAPKLNRWLQANAKETIRTRISYSADIYRRRRTIRDPFDWMVRNVGYNNPVQACAANMTKAAMISIDPKYSIIMPWHDQIILEVKTSQAKQAAKHLKIVMEKAAEYCTGIKGLIKVEPRITKSLAK